MIDEMLPSWRGTAMRELGNVESVVFSRGGTQKHEAYRLNWEWVERRTCNP